MIRRALPALILMSASCAAPGPVSIHTGMTLGEIEKSILEAGGRRVEGAHPFFWADPSGRKGECVYFELPDRTWMQARVERSPSESVTEAGSEVIRFELGQRGRPYRGTSQWSKDGDLHDFPMKIDLADYLYLPSVGRPR